VNLDLPSTSNITSRLSGLERRCFMESIKPEEIVKILVSHGTTVTLEEAKIILDFTWQLADMALDQYLKI
jgi:hypothetical protein